jgi:hypothetical protein
MARTSPEVMKPRILVSFFLLCAAHASRAQTLNPWTLAELAKRADIICTGIPLKVEVIEEKKAEDFLNYIIPPPKRITVARIKVTAVTKGVLPGEIELRFPAPAQKTLTLDAGEAGEDIKLEPGVHYRFYLKRVPGELWYVSALDGEAHEGPAVRQTGKEPPPLPKEEAVELAKIDFLKTDSTAPAGPEKARALYNPEDSSWMVLLYPGKSNDADAWDARIYVNPDKSIDDKSVIFGRTGDDFNKALTGKHVEITLLPTGSKIPVTVRGVVEKTGSRTVTLQVDGTKSTPAKTGTFNKAAIRGMQLLPDPQTTPPAQ